MKRGKEGTKRRDMPPDQANLEDKGRGRKTWRLLRGQCPGPTFRLKILVLDPLLRICVEDPVQM